MSLRTLLIANRGEIAMRILRSARARGLRTVAVYSSADAASPLVQAADLAVPIGPAAVGESYLNLERVLQAARACGADAVHPGYGLLSENAEFARACIEAGLTFVGPDPESIELMADKRAAREAAEKAGVPCVPGFDGGDGSEEAFVEAAARIGYPVMIKAAAGGGGRGMRRADRESELRQALPLAAREAQAAFGDGRLLLERLVVHARHVEVQVFGDRHGNAVHLGERDCSVQRRFQKVLEECPSPAVDSALRDRMGEAALKLVRAAGYVGAGTVEFLLGDDGAFYFLEMNTRLQVEHPVTELVTGLDLVELQLAVAAGEALPISQEELTLTGHAIEARLYAEDPAADFMPQTGPIVALHLPDEPGLRIDHALSQGLEVSAHYDPMLAKVVAHGADRAEALRRLDRGLSELRLLGPRHNRDFLRRVVEHDDFERGEVDTGWLGRQGAALLGEAAPSACEWAVAALALLLHDGRGRDFGELHGFANARPIPFPFDLVVGEVEQRVTLRCVDGGFEAQVGQQPVRMSAARWDRASSELHVLCDGVRQRYVLHVDGERVQLDSGVRIDLRDRTRLPPGGAEGAGSGQIASPMEGKLVELRVKGGDTVERGDVLLVIEAMKLQNNVLADVDGTVARVGAAIGDQVAIGQLLVEIEPAP